MVPCCRRPGWKSPRCHHGAGTNLFDVLLPSRGFREVQHNFQRSSSTDSVSGSVPETASRPTLGTTLAVIHKACGLHPGPGYILLRALECTRPPPRWRVHSVLLFANLRPTPTHAFLGQAEVGPFLLASALLRSSCMRRYQGSNSSKSWAGQ